MAMAVLTVVIASLDSLREKRCVPLTGQSGTACFRDSRGARVQHPTWRSLLRNLLTQCWLRASREPALSV